MVRQRSNKLRERQVGKVDTADVDVKKRDKEEFFTLMTSISVNVRHQFLVHLLNFCQPSWHRPTKLLVAVYFLATFYLDWMTIVPNKALILDLVNKRSDRNRLS